MGYAGGGKTNPTYHDLGDQTETVRVAFDPARISYGQLLDAFWAGHDPAGVEWSRQYRSVILYADEAQKDLALASKARIEQKLGKKTATRIEEAGTFYPAEDYHQKYYLRTWSELMAVLKTIYPTDADLVASTAAARLNGYVSGLSDRADVEKALIAAGVSEKAVTKIVGIMKRAPVRGAVCPG